MNKIEFTNKPWLHKKRQGAQLIRLINSIELILKKENIAAKGKLKDKINEIKEKDPFFVYPIVYLPGKGEVIIIGDTHGDSQSLLAILRQENFLEKVDQGKDVYLVMTGDYADRGKQNVKCLEILLSLKNEYPGHVYLLRGNHEEVAMGQHYGFLGSCIERFGFEKGQMVFQRFNELFEKLPVVMVAANGLVALHGGIPISDIKSLKKINNEDDLTDIRWNDPTEEIEFFVYNYKRGVNYLFGQKTFNSFMDGIGGKVLVRSHEYVTAGYKFLFDNKLLSIFSNGGESEESGYRDFILHPKYVKVNLEKPIKSWTKRHVIDIKYK